MRGASILWWLGMFHLAMSWLFFAFGAGEIWQAMAVSSAVTCFVGSLVVAALGK